MLMTQSGAMPWAARHPVAMLLVIILCRRRRPRPCDETRLLVAQRADECVQRAHGRLAHERLLRIAEDLERRQRRCLLSALRSQPALNFALLSCLTQNARPIKAWGLLSTDTTCERMRSAQSDPRGTRHAPAPQGRPARRQYTQAPRHRGLCAAMWTSGRRCNVTTNRNPGHPFAPGRRGGCTCNRQVCGTITGYNGRVCTPTAGL